MSDFQRQPSGFPFEFRGLKLNSRPDTLAPGKYSVATNVRGYTGSSIRTRPGLSQLFVTTQPSAPITDLRAYVALITDNLPRILGRDSSDRVWLDNGTLAGTLAGAGASAGAMMIPFRPNQSPNPYMYVANGSDYQKFSAPAAGVVTMQKVGIAEPQTAPDAYLFTQNAFNVRASGGVWTPAGTAGAVVTGNRVADTVQAVLKDPISSSRMFSLQVISATLFQKMMPITLNNVLNGSFYVQDVFAPISGPITVQNIYYYSGTTGRCVIVPSRLAGTPGSGESSIYADNLISSLRRGTLLKVNTEIVYVWSVAVGPDGSACIETSTTGTHAAGEAIISVPAIQVVSTGSYTPAVTHTITSLYTDSSIGAGIGTLTATMAPSFNQLSGPAQPDDLVSIGLMVADITKINEIKILFDVGDGTFTKDFYYYTVRPSDLTNAIANSATQLATAQTVTQRAIIDAEAAIAAKNQGKTQSSAQLMAGSQTWGQIVFSLRDLTRVGSDQSKSLLTTNAMQFLVNANGAVDFRMDNGGMFTGGYQLDVGEIGSPFLYCVRPRAQATGVIGNPSPPTRYGTNPRRQEVILALPSAAYDTQIDTWDVFRYGGTVTAWRFIGSIPSSNSFFTDNFTDDAARAGDVLDFDNYEPWPTVDLPNSGAVTGFSGTIAIVSSTTANILRYLPGTLVRLGGQNVYTLRLRPVSLGGGSYRLEFVECASFGNTFLIQEPSMANQNLPYMWGPDANGTVFAVGDPLRPGTLYFSKGNNPDSAPDAYNIEITPPTEPLLGGQVVDGLSYVGSSKRWWALYPTPDNPLARYNVVEVPFPRGIIAPYGHCTDGVSIFSWTKDGIWSTTKGSLTDEDLFNLFPHEGVGGQDVTYNGRTYFAPDYAQANKFRLTHANGFLYAIYVGKTDGIYHTLTLDLHRMAWCEDSWGGGGSTAALFVTCAYQIEQQVQSGGVINNILLFGGRTGGGGSVGMVAVQKEGVNDGPASPITCYLATNEFDAGDIRAPKQWGDLFLDVIPNGAGGNLLSVQPISQGAAVGPLMNLSGSFTRVRTARSMNGIVVSDFMGLYITWTDDFTLIPGPTTLYSWQPSYDIQPARTAGWTTFATSFNMRGFGHIREVALSWLSTAPITLTITSFDGLDPAPITIPSSGGIQLKQIFPVGANKGQLFTFAMASAAEFQIFEDDLEIRVGEWGRDTTYQTYKSFGGRPNASSPI